MMGKIICGFFIVIVSYCGTRYVGNLDNISCALNGIALLTTAILVGMAYCMMHIPSDKRKLELIKESGTHTGNALMVLSVALAAFLQVRPSAKDDLALVLFSGIALAIIALEMYFYYMEVARRFLGTNDEKETDDDERK